MSYNKEEILTNLKSYVTRFSNVVDQFDESDFDKKVREGGWTIRQLLNHLAEAQTQAYIRSKFFITTDNPHILGFDQNVWTEMPDSVMGSPKSAINIIKGIYEKWTILLDNMGDDDWNRPAIHSESGPIKHYESINHFYEHGENHLKQFQNYLDHRS